MSFEKQPAFRRLRSIIAERTNRIVVWLGAGLSVPAGLPSWAGLKDNLCSALIDKVSDVGSGEAESVKKRAEQIRKTPDQWLAFQMLRDALGPTTYRATIRELLQAAETCTIPEGYFSILSLPVTGILTLNLDRLATRAYTCRKPGKLLVEFESSQAGQHLHVLKGSTPFIVNLHGTVSDEKTWILARDELRALLRQEGYKTFVQACLCTRTVVFVGISANDIAVGGHLDTLAEAGIDLGDHFWITDHTDANTEYWAERANLQLIRYRSSGDDHSELQAVLTALADYEPKDESADPVTMVHTSHLNSLPSPEVLQQENDPERIREQLNAHVAKILKPDPKTGNVDYELYDRFCAHYDEAIYRAWYVSSAPPRNKLFGYVLENDVQDGAFGRVFRARDGNGRTVAIKILREEVRRKPEMLQSFRRGVRSMRILAQRKVPGMIPYEEASEIPAMAVMEFVEGPNLQEAVQSEYLKEWSSVLEVGVQMAKIIRQAHLLPERVLHRDLRPPNVMLKNYYAERGILNVVILDFDLSWHIGAQELSVVNRSSLSGFLAPEQVDPKAGMSTRNAAVDSFGIGMTMYYLRTGREPYYLQHLHATWETDLMESIMAYPCRFWESAPVRFARLILNSTRHKQSQRWDMGQIEGELQLLREAVLDPTEVSSTEFIAEELAQRVASAGAHPRYHWNPDELYAELALASGVKLRIIADESERCIKASVEWSNLGDSHYRNVRKYLKPAMDGAVSSLKAQGWKVLPLTHLSSNEVGFAVAIRATELLIDMQHHAKILADALKRFRF